MFSSNSIISVRQMQCIVMLYILSFGFFIFPSVFYNASAIEIIVPAILGGLIMFLVSKLVIFICAGRTRSLYDVFNKNTSAIAGNAIRWIFVLYFILKSATILTMYNNAIKRNILFETPSLVIIGVSLAIAIFISVKGIEVIGRISEILIVFVFAGIFFIFTFALISGGFSDIYINENIDALNIVLSSFKSIYFFQGAEIVLILYTFMGTKEDLNFKGISKAFLLVAGIMIFSVFLISAKLGAIKNSLTVWPFVKVADMIEIPFAFIERQEFIIINLITVFMVFGTAVSIFITSKILAETTKNFAETGKFSLWAGAGVILTLVLKNFNSVFLFLSKAESYLGILCFIVIPVILAIFKRRRTLNEN